MRPLPPVEDLGAGMWSVPVPIPDNPLGYTLVYVLESPRGPLLIDAGWDHEDSWQALVAGLESIGTSIDDVYGLVLTHFHPDHSGLAGRVREASGAWIAMHSADTEMVRGLARLGADGQRARQMRRAEGAGASAAEMDRLAESVPGMAAPALPDRALADGELVDLPQRKLRTVWTPGHTPGHICLHLEDTDHLFTGDHVLPGITPHIGLYTFEGADDPLSEFLASLAQLTDTPEGTRALPAHEHRFTGVAQRAAEIAAHHESRLEELTAALGREAATLWDLSSRLVWKRTWEGMKVTARRMAAAETAAHVRTLEQRGRAARDTPSGADMATGAATDADTVAETDGVPRWRAADAAAETDPARP